MYKYSPYFKTLHDEVQPVGYLGRGTHCSILRCVIWHDQMLSPIKMGKFLDFAVIWDEDHDDRVIQVIEKLYISGLFSPAIFVGERKGSFSLLTANSSKLVPEHGNQSTYQKAVQNISQNQDSDPWPAYVFPYISREHSIINDNYEDVSLYLENLKRLWRLGIKNALSDECSDKPAFKFDEQALLS